MDENKPRRRWLSFGIRDLLWAMVVVGMAVGWWSEKKSVQFVEAQSRRFRGLACEEVLKAQGWTIEQSGEHQIRIVKSGVGDYEWGPK